MMLRPYNRARACGQCQTTTLTFLNRYGETGRHEGLEKAPTCEAPVHLQALWMSQRGNANTEQCTEVDKTAHQQTVDVGKE